MNELLTKINQYIFHGGGEITYEMFQSAIIELCEALEKEEDIDWFCEDIDIELVSSLDDLIVGSYWHFIEWHEGQGSLSYRALCALGRIYHPRGSEKEQNIVYKMLETIEVERNNENSMV